MFSEIAIERIAAEVEATVAAGEQRPQTAIAVADPKLPVVEFEQPGHDHRVEPVAAVEQDGFILGRVAVEHQMGA